MGPSWQLEVTVVERPLAGQDRGHIRTEPLPEARNQGKKGAREKYPRLSLLLPFCLLLVLSWAKPSREPKQCCPQGAAFWDAEQAEG